MPARDECQPPAADIAGRAIGQDIDVIPDRKISVEFCRKEAVSLSAHVEVLEPFAGVEIRHVIIVDVRLYSEPPVAVKAVADNVRAEKDTPTTHDVDGKS